ncbi:hypothetical protein M514_10592 [Trichuris suis]|uniref:Uncharacterized protein n=1 Tax=Trichuris suis TaxID=68888 RepID=A0A085MQH2_9BILA|nr:hypothetical protein M513_10592 [Trichuris suis]KFD59468.1 hypothetical protein M514_28353 [Trichuris suis]KFD60336.1 hypothetical protein M514_10592 [Trichuris suis]
MMRQCPLKDDAALYPNKPCHREFAYKKTTDNEGLIYSEFRLFEISTFGIRLFNIPTVRCFHYSVF